MPLEVTVMPEPDVTDFAAGVPLPPLRDQLKEVARLKQEEIKKREKFKKPDTVKPAIKVNVKDQLSSAVNAYKRREGSFSQHN